MRVAGVLAAAVAAALFLTGCGGDDDDSTAGYSDPLAGIDEGSVPAPPEPVLVPFGREDVLPDGSTYTVTAIPCEQPGMVALEATLQNASQSVMHPNYLMLSLSSEGRYVSSKAGSFGPSCPDPESYAPIFPGESVTFRQNVEIEKGAPLRVMIGYPVDDGTRLQIVPPNALFVSGIPLP